VMGGLITVVGMEVVGRVMFLVSAGEGEGKGLAFGELWDRCMWSEFCYGRGCVEVDTDVMGEVQKSRERLWMLLGFL